jgi:hypothetical protein
MEAGVKAFLSFHYLSKFIFISLVLFHFDFVIADVSHTSTIRREFNEFRPLHYCERCHVGKEQSTASATGVGNYPDDKDDKVIHRVTYQKKVIHRVVFPLSVDSSGAYFYTFHTGY